MNSGEPSRTAIVVAKSQALVGMSPATARLVSPAALRFVQTALQISQHQRFVAGLRHSWFRHLVRLYERLMIPGLALHHALRKQAVEHIVRRELNSGATQVVQIGAGFDSLNHRIHRHLPQAGFMELDHPDTQAAKRRVIDILGGCGDNLALQPVDLFSPDPKITIPSSRRTVVIIEGVLMYFDPCTIRRVLRHIHQQLTPGSLLLFSFMVSPGFQRQSPLVTWWLRASGEPFRWHLPAGELDPFLRPLGFSGCAIHPTHDQGGGSVARGELLAEARPDFTDKSCPEALYSGEHPTAQLVPR